MNTSDKQTNTEPANRAIDDGGWTFQPLESGGVASKSFQIDELRVEVRIIADTFAPAGELASMCEDLDGWMGE